MDLSPVDKKVLNAILNGVLNGADIKIDDLSLPGIVKDLAHNIVKGVDETAKNALSDKRLLKKAEELETKFNLEEVQIIKVEPEVTHAPAEASSVHEGDF